MNNKQVCMIDEMINTVCDPLEKYATDGANEERAPFS